MRVLQVTTHINIGGIANYILTLSEALAAKGVGVVVASSGGNLEEELRSRKIPHRPLNIKTKFEFGPKVIGSIFKLARIIKDEKIDIVRVAMMEVMPAEGRPAGQIKWRICRPEQRQNLVHEWIEPIRIERVGHSDSDP